MPKSTQETGLIRLRDIKTEVSIDSDWFIQRDILLAEVKKLATVSSQEDYQLGANHLTKLTKVSNKVEAMRKDLAEPYAVAVKLIKSTSDVARKPLEDAKDALGKAMATWQRNETECQQKAACLAEEVARKEQERLLHERQIAEEAAKELGLEEPLLPSEPIISVVVAPPPSLVKAYGIRMSETFEISVLDEDKVPRPFMSVDLVKLRRYLNDNKNSIKAQLKDKTQPIQGVEITIESKPVTTGR